MPDPTPSNAEKSQPGDVWLQFGAFAFLGMAAGAPAAESWDALANSVTTPVYSMLVSTPFVVIGLAAIARFIVSPFLDAYRPPVGGALGHRRGWVLVLLVLLAIATVGLVAAGGIRGAAGSGAGLNPGASILFAVSLALSGALLAAVDGLRTAQAKPNRQGLMAAGQYLGTIVPASVFSAFFRSANQDALLWVSIGFLLAGLVGLWLLPGRDATQQPISSIPAVARFLAAEQNLSGWGKRLTAWLHGVFLAPVQALIERLGGALWLAIVALIVADLAGSLQIGRFAMLHAVTAPSLSGSSDMNALQTAATIRSFVWYGGALVGALLVWRYGPVRGLFAALVISGCNLILGVIVAAAAPVQGLYVVLLVIDGIAGGILFIAFVAFVASLCDARHAAFQFTLLWLIAIPGNASAYLQGQLVSDLGTVGTYFVFIALVILSIALVLMLAQKLESANTSRS